MRRLLALSLTSLLLALGGVGVLAAPIAVAAAAVPSTPAEVNGVPTPTLSLSNAEQNAAAAATTTTVTPITTTTSSSSGLSGSDGVLIAIVAVLVLGGIAVYVWRDSRGFAKSIRHHASDDTVYAGAHAGSKAPRKARKLKPAERKRRKRGRAR